MKYEEIKIDESYEVDGEEEKVISKADNHEVVTTIDKYGDVSAWCRSEFSLFKPLLKELPEEGLLVKYDGSLFYRLSGDLGYGFLFGEQWAYIFNDNWIFKLNPNNWQPATPAQEEKFIEMIKKECENHKLFTDTKIENHVSNGATAANRGNCIPCFNPIICWNKNGSIFYKGEFATPLKTTLGQVTNAVKGVASFTIEETESGAIILTPKNKK